MAEPRTDANRRTAIRFVERLGNGVLDDALLVPDPHWWLPGLGTVGRDEFEDGKIALAKEYNDTRHSTEIVGAALLRDSARGREEEVR